MSRRPPPPNRRVDFSFEQRAPRPAAAPPERKKAARGTDPEGVIPVLVEGAGPLFDAVVKAVGAHPRLVAFDGRRGSASGALPAAPAEGGVLLLIDGGALERVVPRIEAALKAGWSVVGSAPALAHPWLYHPELGERLEAAAQAAGRVVLGAGLVPGLVMDRLLAVAGSAVGKVEGFEVERHETFEGAPEAWKSGFPLGGTEDDFETWSARAGAQVEGLAEACALAALGLGLDSDEVEEELAPLLADEDGELMGKRIKAGQVVGMAQSARAFDEGKEVGTLELIRAAGLDGPMDRLRIAGEAGLELSIPKGLGGLKAEAWSLVNTVPSVVAAEAGLLTVLDLPAGR